MPSNTIPIHLHLDSRLIRARLHDTATSRSFLELLPITMQFQDFASQEKVAILPTLLNIDSAPEGSSAAPFTLGYYEPDHALVLYYRHVGYYRGIIPMGVLEGFDIPGLGDSFSATIRRAPSSA